MSKETIDYILLVGDMDPDEDTGLFSFSVIFVSRENAVLALLYYYSLDISTRVQATLVISLISILCISLACEIGLKYLPWQRFELLLFLFSYTRF